jgi:nucleotide-binding universal stress UspA family protein
LQTNTNEFRELRKAAVEAFIAEGLRGVTAVPEFTEGDPAREIVRYAHDNESSLIMMPTHGAGTFRRFLLGSVTAKVLHDARCPVWTSAHIQECASRVSEIPRRILCAVDAGTDAIHVIRWAEAFGQGAEIQLVHAIPKTNGALPFDKRYCEQYSELAREQMRRLAKEADVTLDVRIAEGEPGQVIQAVAEHLKADLVVIGRGRIQKPLGRLRNHAYAIIRDAPCPVISI